MGGPRSLVLATVLGLVACGGEALLPPGLPVVSLLTPAAGAQLRGMVVLTASAAAPTGLRRVDYLVDGQWVATASPGPSWRVTWDSTEVDDGPHDLAVRALDANGGTTTSSPVPVTVVNTRPLGASLSVHLTLGVPDATDFQPAAGASPSTTRYGILREDLTASPPRHEYALSYNSQLRVPGWVSWELNRSWRGSQPRANTYRPDDTLPASLPGPQLADYAEPVFDRGHLCPSGDRTSTFRDNDSTFYLTNMVPQAVHSNQGPWLTLEQALQALAAAGKELFIVAGPLFQGPVRWTRGDSGVAVPTATFKVAVVLEAAGQGVESVTSATRVVSVLVPNDDAWLGLADPWTRYCASPRAIEALTGLNFLSDVPQAVQDLVEARCDPACDPTSASYQAHCR
jgi:endonuclease G